MAIEAIDKWANIFGVAAVLFTLLTAVAGGGAWYFTAKSANIKESDFARFRQNSQEEVAKYNERTAILENETATARLQLEKIKEQQRHRVLSEAQVTQIVTALKRNASGTVFFAIQEQIEDGRGYAASIANALGQAGYSIIPQPGVITSGARRDVEVYAPGNPEGDKIREVLQKNGVAISKDPAPGIRMGIGTAGPGVIEIRVGAKSLN